jgi:hypothetical protein
MSGMSSHPNTGRWIQIHTLNAAKAVILVFPGLVVRSTTLIAAHGNDAVIIFTRITGNAINGLMETKLVQS